MIKNIASLLKNQQLTKKSVEITPEIVHNPEKYFEFKSGYEHKAFDIVFKFSLENKTMYFSQSWLAKEIGVSRKTVNEMMGRWHKDGIVEKEYRHRTTCLYRLHDIFKIPYMKSRLSHMFKSLRLSALLLLGACFQTEVTASSIKNYYVNGINNTYNKNRMQGISIQVHNLPITLKQKIDLCAFPDHVLEYAIWELERPFKTIQKKLSYLFKVCFDRCNALGIKPDWAWVNKLHMIYEQRSIKPKHAFVEEIKNDTGLLVTTPPVAVTPPAVLPPGLLSKSELERKMAQYRALSVPIESLMASQMRRVELLSPEQKLLWEKT